MFISHKIYPRQGACFTCTFACTSKKTRTFFKKTKSFPKKTIVFVKNFKTFLKKLEEFSENFKVFSKGTLQPFIIALNFHISFINRGLALF
ncbi:hypothetical protein DW175_02460 [Bacteroides sp. AM16-15]|nr:hypothetical protein DW175_02460 [Bacteroides sp. AM16-15]